MSSGRKLFFVMTAPRALAAYRTLSRAINFTFGKDAVMRTAAYQKMREGFLENAGLDNPETLDQKIQDAFDAATILRVNVVQGQREAGESAYKLNIHNETELGDNDSRFDPPKGFKSRPFKKCSD